MKRREYKQKELDLIQKLKRENDRLKKSISSLRKQLQRVDLDRYENLKDIILKHEQNELEEQMAEQQYKLQKKWECHECGEGFLTLNVLTRKDGLVYYRKCTCCSYRTTTKPYHDKVEGIKKDES